MSNVKTFRALTMGVLIALSFSALARAQMARQPGAVYDADKRGKRLAPLQNEISVAFGSPPRGRRGHPGERGARDGVLSARQSHGQILHRKESTGNRHWLRYARLFETREAEPPYTDLGRKVLAAHKPTEGYRMVPPALTNDPLPGCDPQGFPRIVLHNFRTSQIVQTPKEVVILYEFNKKWRAIWTGWTATAEECRGTYLGRSGSARVAMVGLFGGSVGG